jgi:hypothetical protein
LGEWLALDLHSGKSSGTISLDQTDAQQEGIATVVVAVAAYWFIENYPDTSKFLTKAERTFIHERLAADSDAIRQEQFSWAAVREALRDPSCWLYGLGFHTMSLPLYTLSLFLVSLYRCDSINPDAHIVNLAHHH